MATRTEIKGDCDTKFRAVQDAFAENFVSQGEVGAAVAVYVDGTQVVDLFGGYADSAKTRPWERDTILTVYSTTKGITATCAHRLVDQGKLDVDAPVARYWPEFAQAGKENIPVRYLLGHRAGLPAIKAPLPPSALFDWDTMTGAIAAQEPWWEPGTRHGYHALTFGWLVGQVVRRISGVSLGTFLRQEVAGPLGIDFQVGFGAEHDHRVAEMIAPAPVPGEPDPLVELMKTPESMNAKAMLNPGFTPGVTDNSREWRAAEIPAANGHTNARALSRLYGALSLGGELDGVRVLSQEAIQRATTEQSNGEDALLGVPMRFGLGYFLTNETFTLGPNSHTFGHMGRGGSVGFADPDARVGFGYVMNQMRGGIGIDPRYASMIDAVYAAL